jgi:hypothetical protein
MEQGNQGGTCQNEHVNQLSQARPVTQHVGNLPGKLKEATGVGCNNLAIGVISLSMEEGSIPWNPNTSFWGRSPQQNRQPMPVL